MLILWQFPARKESRGLQFAAVKVLIFCCQGA